MKKILAAVLCLPVITLSGCDKTDEQEKISLPEEFCITAEISDREFACTAEMKRSEGMWEIAVTSPERLDGMTITLTDSDCTVSYSDLSYTVESKKIPDTSPIKLTALSLDKCVNGYSEGSVCGTDYVFSFGDTSPDSLQIGSDITVKFSDFE
jgi:hypothetical protein